jgi:hypothetical protein
LRAWLEGSVKAGGTAPVPLAPRAAGALCA